MEQLLAEPEYGDIVDTLLDFNTCAFSVPESYIKEFSASESVVTNNNLGNDLNNLSSVSQMSVKFLVVLSITNDIFLFLTNHLDAVQRGLSEEDKTREKVCTLKCSHNLLILCYRDFMCFGLFMVFLISQLFLITYA